MTSHARLRPIVPACFGAALICGLAASTPRASAADLPTHKGVYVVEVSPCEQYRRIYTDALSSARQIARLFRRDDGQFHRLKRRRMNDGFDGPDIRINAKLTGEQIDVAVLTTRVEIFVRKARQLGCYSRAGLNRADNEAANINREIAQAVIWFDPQSFQ
jgi:hypothetical protein